jgi:hypothetical protein
VNRNLLHDRAACQRVNVPQNAAPWATLGLAGGLLLSALTSFALGGVYGYVYLAAGGLCAMLALGLAVRSGAVEARP